jgi:hypothetical protein
LCASIAPIMAALDTDAAFIIWHSKIITSSRARPAAGLYRHSAWKSCDTEIIDRRPAPIQAFSHVRVIR